MQNKYTCIKGDCLSEMAKLASGTIKAICTDPPYKYLENQELESDYDEDTFVREANRVLAADSMLLVFGRGESFDRLKYKIANYRGVLQTAEGEIFCNIYEPQSEIEKAGLALLLEKGYKAVYIGKKERFTFKECLAWDKSYNSSPVLPISRVHEDIAIYAKGNAKINKSKVPYLEMKAHNLDSIIQDVKRIKSALGNPKSLAKMLEYLENNKLVFNEKHTFKHGVTTGEGIKDINTNVHILHTIGNGMTEKSIIRTDFDRDLNSKETTCSNDLKGSDRVIDLVNSMESGMRESSVIRTDFDRDSKTISGNDFNGGDIPTTYLNAIEQGMREKSIIHEKREHYGTIHETQKPVRLIERLLALISKEGDLILDTFAGSHSTGVACQNTKRRFIGFEILDRYHEAGKQRMAENDKRLFQEQAQQSLL